MTADREMRELERRWQQSGAPEDEDAWLVALRRQGRLRPAGLAMAAACGDAGACRLLGDARPTVSRVELGIITDTSEATVGKWSVKRGCPRIDARNHDPIAVLDWRRQTIAAYDEGASATALVARPPTRTSRPMTSTRSTTA